MVNLFFLVLFVGLVSSTVQNKLSNWMTIVDLIKLSELQLEGNIVTLKSFKESTEDFFTSLEKDKSKIA
jgi:hypothetical protein